MVLPGTQTNWAAFAAAAFTLPMETNWSRVGSAQQYHGSSMYGTAARGKADAGLLSSSCPAAECAASQMRPKISVRERFCFSPCSTASEILRQRASTRASSCFQGNTSELGSNGPTIPRTSGSSSSREPAGISSRIASCTGATFSARPSCASTPSKSQ